MKKHSTKRKQEKSHIILALDFAFYIFCAYVAVSAAATGHVWWIAVILGLAMYASLTAVYYGLASTLRLPQLRYKNSIAAVVAFSILGLAS